MNEPPVCGRCESEYSLNDGCEPSRYCNYCAQEKIPELEQQIESREAKISELEQQILPIQSNLAAAENRTHRLEKALKDILHHQSIVLGKLGTGGAPMNMSITAAIAIKALEPEEKLREGK